MSARNRSPKAKPVMPCATASSQTVFMRRSYSEFEHGQGRSTTFRGKPAASACCSTSARRVLCMATRSKAELTVVTSPAISYSPWQRNICSAQALSLPLLQESKILGFINSIQHSVHYPRIGIADHCPEAFFGLHLVLGRALRILALSILKRAVISTDSEGAKRLRGSGEIPRMCPCGADTRCSTQAQD